MKNLITKSAVGLMALGLTFSATVTPAFAQDESYTIQPEDLGQTPKNVILLISDGMSTDYVTGHRYFSQGVLGSELTPLNYEQYLVGSLMTHPEHDTPAVTDSAAAGTAMATGTKTSNGTLGLSSDGEPLESSLKVAKQNGKATGLVATSTITHATPAAFVANVESRNDEITIADQYFDTVINDEIVVDVLLGGGLSNFDRSDRNLVEEFQAEGYDFATNLEELEASESPQLLGLFADGALSPELDRPEDEPSLANMTQSAIDALNQDEDGFFLMVEGSQVDWAGHANDGVWAMTDMEAFIQAVDTAIEFAEEDGETLVIVTADHETGGLIIGSGGYDFNFEPLQQLSNTPYYIAEAVVEAGDAEAVYDYVEFELTANEMAVIEDALLPLGEGAVAIETVLKEAVDVRAHLGWGGRGDHTATDVPVYAFGPGFENFMGTIDNTFIGTGLKELMGGSVSEETTEEETTEEGTEGSEEETTEEDTEGTEEVIEEEGSEEDAE